MIIMKRNLLILLSLLPLLLWSQVSFVAQAPSQVQAGQQFQVSFILTNAQGADFTAPSFHNFEVLAGPMTAHYHSFQDINGKSISTSSHAYKYILSAKKKGRFRIPSASIKANGRVMRTAPLNIIIDETASPQLQSRPSAVSTPVRSHHAKIGEQDLFFSAELSRQKVYEQTPVMLTYKFHSLPGVGLVNVSLRQKPDLKGFWTQEIALPRNLSPQVEIISGKQYRVGKNLQFLIFPQQAGKLNIPAVTFDCEVLQENGTLDEIEAFFRGGGSLSSHLRRTTQHLSLEVLPLPSPRPANFSGGVGRLTTYGQLLGSTPKTNDIATYRITIKGTGNLKLIKAPTLKFPKKIDAYPPKLEEQTQTSYEGLSGEIHFDYNFVPREVGTFTIPSAEFSYFDTKRETYVTLHTAPLPLNIQKGKRSMAEVDAELAFQRSDIRDIHLGEATIFSERSFLWIGSLAYFFVIGIIILCAVLLWTFLPRFYAQFTDTDAKRTRKASAKAFQRMRSVEKLLKDENHQLFYNAMAEVMIGYFADKFKEERTSLTHHHIEQRLRERGITESDLIETHQVLEEIDFGRFAPSLEKVCRKELFQRVNSLLQRLETQIQ